MDETKEMREELRAYVERAARQGYPAQQVEAARAVLAAVPDGSVRALKATRSVIRSLLPGADRDPVDLAYARAASLARRVGAHLADPGGHRQPSHAWMAGTLARAWHGGTWREALAALALDTDARADDVRRHIRAILQAVDDVASDRHAGMTAPRDGASQAYVRIWDHLAKTAPKTTPKKKKK